MNKCDFCWKKCISDRHKITVRAINHKIPLKKALTSSS